MLTALDFDEDDISRICYLIANHHTYTNIDGADYRILVEADFLVNLYEGNKSPDVIRETCAHIFKTSAGRGICAKMFGIEM